MAGSIVCNTINTDTAGGAFTTQNALTGIQQVWVSYNCSTQTINSSFNVSSVTYVATGDVTVNFSITFADTNYCVTGACSGDYGSTRGGMVTLNRNATTGALVSPTTTSIRINAVNDAGNSYNAAYLNIHITR